MLEFIHITATYSNALLVAIFPQVADFNTKLGLTSTQAVFINQVKEFRPSPIKDMVGGGMILSNGFWFLYDQGIVRGFRSPNNVFYDDDPATNWPRYAFGKDNMTTNEAIVMARSILKRLGYEPAQLHADGPPTEFTGPSDTNDGRHVPHCRVEWRRYPAPKSDEEQQDNDIVTVEINMEAKTLTGLHLTSRKLWKESPKLDVVPELEKDYQIRTGGNMFIRTNAPSTVPRK